MLELSARQGAVRRPQGGLLTVTNHCQSAAMKGLKGRFPPRPPFSPLSSYQFTEAYSRARNDSGSWLWAEGWVRRRSRQSWRITRLLTPVPPCAPSFP